MKHLIGSLSTPQDPELVNSKFWYMDFCLLAYKAVSGATFSPQAKQNLTICLTLLGMHLPTYQSEQTASQNKDCAAQKPTVPYSFTQ